MSLKYENIKEFTKSLENRQKYKNFAKYYLKHKQFDKSLFDPQQKIFVYNQTRASDNAGK